MLCVAHMYTVYMYGHLYWERVTLKVSYFVKLRAVWLGAQYTHVRHVQCTCVPSS